MKMATRKGNTFRVWKLVIVMLNLLEPNYLFINLDKVLYIRIIIAHSKFKHGLNFNLQKPKPSPTNSFANALLLLIPFSNFNTA